MKRALVNARHEEYLQRFVECEEYNLDMLKAIDEVSRLLDDAHDGIRDQAERILLIAATQDDSHKPWDIACEHCMLYCNEAAHELLFGGKAHPMLEPLVADIVRSWLPEDTSYDVRDPKEVIMRFVRIGTIISLNSLNDQLTSSEDPEEIIMETADFTAAFLRSVIWEKKKDMLLEIEHIWTDGAHEKLPRCIDLVFSRAIEKLDA